jgi:glycosyltransferase involved in cell wall biosynthesis
LTVLHVIAAAGLGGSERALVSLLRGVDANRIAVHVVCHDTGPMVEVYARHAASLTPVDFTSWFSASTVGRLVRLMRDVRFDIVHTHLYRADVQGGLAAVRARVPIRIATVHGEYWRRDGAGEGHRARRAGMSLAYRNVYRLFDRVVAVSQGIAADLATRAGTKVGRDKIAVIPVGRDVVAPSGDEVARVRDELGIGDGPVLVTVANFFAAKGHRYLIDAMPAILRRHPRATLVLVGSGPLLDDVRAQVRRLGIVDRVVLAGSRPRVEPLLSLADLVVLPSVSEGLPVVVLETLGLGKPLVATRVGGIPDVVADGTSGVLVPPSDPEALAGAVCTLLDDPARAAQLASAGPGLVRTRYSEAAMVRDTEQLYLGLALAKGLIAQGP